MSTEGDDIDDLLADLAEFDDDIEPEEEDDLSDFEEEFEDEVEIPITRLDSTGNVKSRGEESVKVKAEPPTLGRDRERSRPGLIATPATKTSEVIRRPLMSGHCAFPQSANPDESHARCKGYSRANPDKIFQPCPDLCHYPKERYECAGCGGTILAAPHYPLDEDGDIRYVHLDTKRNRASDEECPR